MGSGSKSIFIIKTEYPLTAVKSTEDTILEAAREVFMQKGFAAARMCEIAKAANINQALVHYYFRKKDNDYKCRPTVFNAFGAGPAAAKHVHGISQLD